MPTDLLPVLIFILVLSMLVMLLWSRHRYGDAEAVKGMGKLPFWGWFVLLMLPPLVLIPLQNYAQAAGFGELLEMILGVIIAIISLRYAFLLRKFSSLGKTAKE